MTNWPEGGSAPLKEPFPGSEEMVQKIRAIYEDDYEPNPLERNRKIRAVLVSVHTTAKQRHWTGSRWE